ncbi:sensor histidine kinase [Dactylosporangium sp. CA-139066]|uniref:sensor histidine kinase n=1 Tax=Dactylosporangium sp. CA-139066 TaxID=3239930 RepID=UPI003D91628E
MAAEESTPALAALDAGRAQRAAVIRWLRPLAPLVMAVVVWGAWTTTPAPALSGAGRPVLIALAAFVLCGAGVVLTVSGRRLPLHAAFVGGLLAASIALVWLQPDGVGVAGIFVGISFLAPLLRWHISIPITVVALVLIAVVITSARNGSLTSALLDAVMVGAFYGMLVFAMRLGEANQQAERLVEELERGRAAQAEAARLAERQWLAREMHDVLAHSLSGLMLQLEGARMLAVREPGDPRLPVAIERAQQLGRAGLDEARRAIGLLRDAELPSLSELTAGFARDHGVPCAFDQEGPERPLPSPAQLAVYRVAQEALTNAARHARPSRVAVRLSYGDDAVHLTVEDFGEPPPVPVPGVGYGLTGMRERAELLGGSLAAAPTATGFRVELRVPA